MKEVIVSPTKPLVTAHIHEVDQPKPAENQILIKVVVAGSNPKDYKHLLATNSSLNSGDDIAGYVAELGSAVAATHEFKVGDAVAAFHTMAAPNGAYAEYALAPASTTFHIPDGTSFESAATIPLTTLAAALPLFRRQDLPPPWTKRSSRAAPLPLIIYGASSALGTFAIKMARQAGIHPIIAIAGGSSAYVQKFLDKSRGDALVDYRKGPEAMKADVKAALNGTPALHALDCICENKTWVSVAQMLSPGGNVSVIQGSEKYDEPELPANVDISYSFVGSSHSGAFRPNMPKPPADPETVKGDIDFAYVLCRYLARSLANGEFEGHPYEVIPGGLNGVETGLQKLQRGEAKAVKYVYRVSV